MQTPIVVVHRHDPQQQDAGRPFSPVQSVCQCQWVFLLRLGLRMRLSDLLMLWAVNLLELSNAAEHNTPTVATAIGLLALAVQAENSGRPYQSLGRR